MTPQHNCGSELPEEGTYIDERFWLIMPDGHEVMHCWTGDRWITEDVVFMVEDASWIDRPAVVKPEGTPIPLRIFRNMP